MGLTPAEAMGVVVAEGVLITILVLLGKPFCVAHVRQTQRLIGLPLGPIARPAPPRRPPSGSAPAPVASRLRHTRDAPPR